jgi:hypothetical protein
MAKRRSKRTRRSKRAVSKRIRINDKKVRRTKRRKRRTKRIKLYGGMDGDGEGDLVPPIVGQQIQDGDEDGDDEAPVIDMTPSDLHGEIMRLETRIDELEEKQKICCSDKDMAAENIQRVYRGHQGRDAFKVTRRSRKPNVTDELLDLPLEVSDLIMAERDKIPMVTQGWIIFKDADAFPGENRVNEDHNQPLQSYINYCNKNNLNGFAHCPEQNMGFTRSLQQASSPDILIDNIKSFPRPSHHWKCNTWVAPGASFELIRQKIDEGFIIEFEDDEDRARL